jgi:hypothetical protein
MSDAPNNGHEATDQTPENEFEAPAIVALGKLDEITFGSVMYIPSEGATSYV